MSIVDLRHFFLKIQNPGQNTRPSIDKTAFRKGKSFKNFKKDVPSAVIYPIIHNVWFSDRIWVHPQRRPQLTIFFLSNWCGNLKSNFEILYKALCKCRKVKKWKIHNFFFVYVNIFKRTHGPYVNISKHFADHLPTPNCKRNLWRLP